MKQKSNRILFLFIVMMFLSAILATTAFSAQGVLKNVGSIGGIYDDVAYGVSAYSNGDFVLSGSAYGSSLGTGDFDSLVPKGDNDTIVNVFDYDPDTDTYASGYMYNFGGSDNDWARNIVSFSNGGFAYVGTSYFNSFNTGDWVNIAGKGESDAMFVLSNGDFNTGLKGLNHGTEDYDDFYDIVETSDGYLMAVGDFNFISKAVKLTKNGEIVDSASLTGEGTSVFYAVASTSDGGCVAVGSASRYAFGTGDWDGLTKKGGWDDAVIVKFDSDLNVVWKNNFGGEDSEWFNAVTPTSDGGFIAVGVSYAESFDTGDWIGVDAKGESDGIIVKFGADGNMLWCKNFGGADYDYLTNVASTVDGGYVVVGYCQANSFTTGDLVDVDGKGDTDAVIIKYDADDNIAWQDFFGGEGEDWFNAVDVKNSGDIVVVGNSDEESFGNNDLENLTGKGFRDIIYAVYGDMDAHAVKFLKYANNKDVIYEEQSVISGNAAVQPAVNPVRIGFTFAGWYTDEECRIPFNFNAPVTADGYAYPKWRAVGADVTVSYNDGLEDHETTVPYGSRVTITAVAENSGGFPFESWIGPLERLYSFDLAYSFIAMEDIYLESTYADDLQSPSPIVNIEYTNILVSEPDAYNRVNISFFGDIVVPEGFTVKERGFVGSYYIRENPVYNWREENLLLGASNTARIKVPGVNTKVQGTFLRVTNGYDFCARTYLVYNDGTEDQIIYSRVSYYDGTPIP